MGPQRQAVGSCPLSFWPSFPQRRPPGPWCVLHCSRRLCQPSRDPSPDPALKLHPCTHDNSGGCPIVVLVVKNPPANAGDIRDTGSVPGSGRSPGGGHGNPPQCSCLENPHGQRNLVSYSPWGHKELDMTERLSTAQHSTAQHIDFRNQVQIFKF